MADSFWKTDLDEQAGRVGNPSWQDKFRSTASAIRDLREGEHSYDVLLQVDGHDLKAHSFLLILRSPVFEALLSQRWRQSDSPVVRTIGFEAPVTSKGLSCLLDHVYGVGMSLDCENVYQAWSCAHYFQLEGMKLECLDFYMNACKKQKSVCVALCMPILQAFEDFGDVTSETAEVAKAFWDFLDLNAVDVLSEQGNFVACSSDMMRKVLSRTTLRVPSERFLLDALEVFVTAKLKVSKDPPPKRTFLAENHLLWTIRYHHLSVEDLVGIDFLTPQESVKILQQCQTTKKKECSALVTNNDLAEKGAAGMQQELCFLPRRCPYSIIRRSYLPVIRLPEQQNGGADDLMEKRGGNRDGIQIAVSQTAFLKSVLLAGPKYEDILIGATLKIYDGVTNVLASFEQQCQMAKGELYEFVLQPEFLLLAHKNYRLVLELPGDTGRLFFAKYTGGSFKSVVDCTERDFKVGDQIEVCTHKCAGKKNSLIWSPGSINNVSLDGSMLQVMYKDGTVEVVAQETVRSLSSHEEDQMLTVCWGVLANTPDQNQSKERTNLYEGEFPGVCLSLSGLPKFCSQEHVRLIGSAASQLEASVICWGRREDDDDSGSYKVQVQNRGILTVSEEHLCKSEALPKAPPGGPASRNQTLSL